MNLWWSLTCLILQQFVTLFVLYDIIQLYVIFYWHILDIIILFSVTYKSLPISFTPDSLNEIVNNKDIPTPLNMWFDHAYFNAKSLLLSQ